MYEYNARVVDVYDGDTLRCDIDQGLDVWTHNESIRLFGINTPELRLATMAAGIAARDALRFRVLGQWVVLNTIKDKTEKYGRYLGVIWLNGENINKWMVEQGFAVPYMEG